MEIRGRTVERCLVRVAERVARRGVVGAEWWRTKVCACPVRAVGPVNTMTSPTVSKLRLLISRIRPQQSSKPESHKVAVKERTNHGRPRGPQYRILNPSFIINYTQGAVSHSPCLKSFRTNDRLINLRPTSKVPVRVLNHHFLPYSLYHCSVDHSTGSPTSLLRRVRPKFRLRKRNIRVQVVPIYL